MRRTRRALPFVAAFLLATLGSALAADRDSSPRLLQSLQNSVVEPALQSLTATVEARIEGVQKLLAHGDRCYKPKPNHYRTFIKRFWFWR